MLKDRDFGQTWNKIHPNEYMSLFGVGIAVAPSSSGIARSSGAIHRTVPFKADVKYDMPTNSTAITERPKSDRWALPSDEMRTLDCKHDHRQ